MPGCYRIVRSVAVNVAALDFVTVARARGESTGYVMLHEVLPNILGPCWPISGCASSMSCCCCRASRFLGLGVQPPRRTGARWCVKTSAASPYGAPAVIMPALAIASLTISVNLTIDAIFGRSKTGATDVSALIEITDLRVAARASRTDRDIEFVKGVSFSVERGQVMGLIGESGSGKTTIALAVMGYTRYGCRISGGRVRIGDTDVTALDAKDLRNFRGRRVAYIAQSAAAAFNPVTHDHGAGHRKRAHPWHREQGGREAKAIELVQGAGHPRT